MRCPFPADLPLFARSQLLADSGAITAEFAAVLPAVVLVLACALGAMQLSDEQLRLQGAASTAARLLGRGDAGASEVIEAVSAGAQLTARSSGPLICADVTAPASVGVVISLTLTASACALLDDQP
jgi:Flp pilus assembly protein TadG